MCTKDKRLRRHLLHPVDLLIGQTGKERISSVRVRRTEILSKALYCSEFKTRNLVLAEIKRGFVFLLPPRFREESKFMLKYFLILFVLTFHASFVNGKSLYSSDEYFSGQTASSNKILIR